MTIVTVGERIRALREDRKLTQKQLGDLCGMADSAIRKYESGTVRPKLETLDRISKALDVDTIVLTRNDPHYPINITFHFDDDDTSGDFYNRLRNWIFGEAHLVRISKALEQLNDDGQSEAVKRVEELTEVPRYQRTLPDNSADPTDAANNSGEETHPPKAKAP